jgi:hypothetical protein
MFSQMNPHESQNTAYTKEMKTPVMMTGFFHANQINGATSGGAMPSTISSVRRRKRIGGFSRFALERQTPSRRHH